MRPWPMRAARGVEAARQLEELILLAPGVMMGRPEAEIPATGRAALAGGTVGRQGLPETVRDRRFAGAPRCAGPEAGAGRACTGAAGRVAARPRAAARPGESGGRPGRRGRCDHRPLGAKRHEPPRAARVRGAGAPGWRPTPAAKPASAPRAVRPCRPRRMPCAAPSTSGCGVRRTYGNGTCCARS